jgi:hypothetical protein
MRTVTLRNLGVVDVRIIQRRPDVRIARSAAAGRAHALHDHDFCLIAAIVVNEE